MANPGHALAATNLAEITVLKAEVAMLKSNNEVNLRNLETGIKELLKLLKKKNVISEEEMNILDAKFLFISSSGVW